MVLTVLGWILWGGVAVLTLGVLLSGNRDGGVRYMMRTHAIVLAIRLAEGFILNSSHSKDST